MHTSLRSYLLFSMFDAFVNNNIRLLKADMTQLYTCADNSKSNTK